jgi:hypothetical protein
MRSRWGSRAAAGYFLLLSAAAGYVTYQALFNRTRFLFPGTLLLSLGLPWTRTMTDGTGWPALLVSFAVNLGAFYFIGAQLEQLGRSNR